MGIPTEGAYFYGKIQTALKCGTKHFSANMFKMALY